MKNVHNPDSCPPKMRLKTNKSIPSSNLFFKKNSMFSRHLPCGSDTGINVTVADSGTGNKYYMDGKLNGETLVLYRGRTYVFDLSDASNSTGGDHPLFFRTANDNTTNKIAGQTATYKDDGTAAAGGVAVGKAGARLTFVVPNNAPDKIFYVCGLHANMGSEGFATVKTRGDFAKSKKHGSYKRYLMNRVGKEHIKNKYNVNTNKFEKDCSNN